jgi:galactose mutarotase-like enzyme
LARRGAAGTFSVERRHDLRQIWERHLLESARNGISFGRTQERAAQLHTLENKRLRARSNDYAGTLDGSAPRRAGLYRQSAGFACEPQGFSNAANQPNFPATILRPGRMYREKIVYRLTADGARGRR